MKKSSKDIIGMILFLTPAVALFMAFFIYPVGFVALTSMLKWDGMSVPAFAGFKNFFYILGDEVFQRSIYVNIVWAFAGGFIQVPLAVMVAMLLSERPKGWKFFRTIYFLPNIISGVALAMMWSAIYNNEYGAFNALLKLAGLGSLQRNWLGEMDSALPAMIVYWLLYIGYFMVIVLAEISSIPDTYYEAAGIDGATRLQQNFYITLPLIKGSVSTCITLAMIYGLRQFEQVYLITNGGPGYQTSVMSLYLYKQLQTYNFGLANASGVVLICIGAIVIVTIKSMFKVEQYQV